MPCMAVTWFLQSPGYQQSRYWLCLINVSFFPQHVTYMCYLGVGKSINKRIRYFYRFFNKSITTKLMINLRWTLLCVAYKHFVHSCLRSPWAWGLQSAQRVRKLEIAENCTWLKDQAQFNLTGAPVTNTYELKSKHAKSITSILMYALILLTHSQTSTMQLFKFQNRYVIPFHSLLGMRLHVIIHPVIKVNPF